jgi:hypothetical protein
VVPLDVTIMSLLKNKCIQNFGGETSEKVTIGKQIRIREDNIKMHLRYVDYEDGRLMELAQDRAYWRTLVFSMLNLQMLLTENSWSVS